MNEVVIPAPLIQAEKGVVITDDIARAAYGDNYKQMQIPAIVDLD